MGASPSKSGKQMMNWTSEKARVFHWRRLPLSKTPTFIFPVLLLVHPEPRPKMGKTREMSDVSVKETARVKTCRARSHFVFALGSLYLLTLPANNYINYIRRNPWIQAWHPEPKAPLGSLGIEFWVVHTHTHFQEGEQRARARKENRRVELKWVPFPLRLFSPLLLP